jgi:hypothetical protein
MLDHEGVDGPVAAMLVEFFVSTGYKDWANKALQEVVRQSQSTQPVVVADALFRYGQAWNDRDSLKRSHQMYEELIRQYPSEIELHRRLDTLGRLLSPATSATTTTSAAPR